MDVVPIWARLLGLFFLLLISGFFSVAETAMLAVSRFRLRHLASSGGRRAKLALHLLERNGHRIGTLLLARTVINSAAAILAAGVAFDCFHDSRYALGIAAIAVSLAIILFSEIVPKLIGAAYAERIVLVIAPVLYAVMWLLSPLVWLINAVVDFLLRRVRQQSSETVMSAEELRSVVLESGTFIPQRHKRILLDLLGLENLSVEDVMTPRAQIEALDLSAPIEQLRHQLATCFHSKLPVYEGEINRIAGVLHVRKALALLDIDKELSAEHLRRLLTAPRFIPQGTGVLTQLQYFQRDHERLALVVDEYGEVQGLITREDIIAEMIGGFTETLPGATSADRLHWNEAGECLLEGASLLRDINRDLALDFPLEGPKTLNGWLLEELKDIPDANVCVKREDCIVEIVQTQNQAVKIVKLIRR